VAFPLTLAMDWRAVLATPVLVPGTGIGSRMGPLPAVGRLDGSSVMAIHTFHVLSWTDELQCGIGA
jgi:hypothetical protein